MQPKLQPALPYVPMMSRWQPSFKTPLAKRYAVSLARHATPSHGLRNSTLPIVSYAIVHER